jgi:hypothetical protein
MTEQEDTYQGICDAVMRSYNLNPVVKERQMYESETEFINNIRSNFIRGITYKHVLTYPPLEKQDKITKSPEKYQLLSLMRVDFLKHE